MAILYLIFIVLVVLIITYFVLLNKIKLYGKGISDISEIPGFNLKNSILNPINLNILILNNINYDHCFIATFNDNKKKNFNSGIFKFIYPFKNYSEYYYYSCIALETPYRKIITKNSKLYHLINDRYILLNYMEENNITEKTALREIKFRKLIHK